MSVDLTKILIVDDELLLRNGIKYICDWEAEGFKIVGEAGNGKEAMKLVQELQPDIVITDIIMPEMDGIDLTAQIKSQYSDISILVLSSYDNFNYVKSIFLNGAGNYLLKPNLDASQLIETLRKLKPLTKPKENSIKHTAEYILLKMIEHEDFRSNNALLSLEENTGICFDSNEPFYLLNLKLNWPPSDIGQIKTVLKSELATGINTKKAAIAAYNKQNIVVLLQSACREPEIIKLFDRIMGSSFMLQNAPIAVCMSEPFYDISALSRIFHNTLNKCEYGFYFTTNIIISDNMINPSYVSMNTKEISKELDILNIERVKELIIDYVKAVSETLSIEPYLLKKNIESQFYFTIQTISSAGFNVSELNKLKIKFFRIIDEVSNYVELIKVINNAFNDIADTISIELNARNRDVLSPVWEYINSHCCEDIKLSDVASAVHLNYSYLSSLFRIKSNESFTDCLHKARINRAKELLRTQNITISNVSTMVGFIDQSHFSKVFKKLENMSPKEYQKIFYSRNITSNKK